MRRLALGRNGPIFNSERLLAPNAWAGPQPIHFSAQDGQGLLVSDAERPHASRELPGFAGRELPGRRRRTGDERAVSPTGLEEAGSFQFAVRASHRVDRQAEIGGELADRGQTDVRLKTAAVDRAGNLFPDLLKRGQRRLGIQDDKIDQVHRLHV